jgi:hypothetical protein
MDLSLPMVAVVDGVMDPMDLVEEEEPYKLHRLMNDFL